MASSAIAFGFSMAVTTPIFQGGALMHQERAAKAAYQQSAEQLYPAGNVIEISSQSPV